MHFNLSVHIWLLLRKLGDLFNLLVTLARAYQSGVHYLSRLIVLLTNIRQAATHLPRTNTLAYFTSLSLTKKKVFITLPPGMLPEA
jgi:hypothetical protein